LVTAPLCLGEDSIPSFPSPSPLSRIFALRRHSPPASKRRVPFLIRNFVPHNSPHARPKNSPPPLTLPCVAPLFTSFGPHPSPASRFPPPPRIATLETQFTVVRSLSLDVFFPAVSVNNSVWTTPEIFFQFASLVLAEVALLLCPILIGGNL